MIRFRIGFFALVTGVMLAWVVPAVAASRPKQTSRVAVVAGQPSEFAFKLSRKAFPAGSVTFSVANKGTLPHDFKFCTAISKKLTNACVGKVTKLIAPGKSATLTVKLSKIGKHEFLCTLPGHAAAGMKGFLSVTRAPVSTKARSMAVDVSAGKPSELAFKLSKLSNLPTGKVTFNVTNAGQIAHNFELCLVPTAKLPNACPGKSKRTAFLQPGKSASFAVTLTRKGTYEYLCTFPGHAAAGMKGLLGVGVKITSSEVAKAIKASAATPTPSTTTTTTSSPTTTTTAAPPPPTTTTPVIVNDGCPAGTTIATSGNTDNDTDEAGQPTDGDGCI